MTNVFYVFFRTGFSSAHPFAGLFISYDFKITGITNNNYFKQTYD